MRYLFRFLYQESSRAHKYYKQRISDLRAQTNTDRGNDADTEGADGEDAAADRKKQRKKKRSRWGPQEAPESSADNGGTPAPPPPPPGKTQP